MKHLAFVLCFVLAGPAVRSQEAQGYYRFPTLHENTIVFVAEGDLWSVSADGGIARRLTTHPSEETHPVLSPDGATVAFAARYEGPTELYTMPLSGGLPKRWTYEREPSLPIGWTPSGKLLYSTAHYSTLPNIQLVSLDLVSAARERIPLSQASEAVYDDTGTQLFFVRPAFHRNVTKRYRGGTARKIWKFVEGAAEAEALTADYPGESHSPMWWQGRVYFVSDRDGTMNLWSMNEAGQDLRQHSRHSGWDVRTPSLSMGRIVYQNGADLWIYDIATDQSRRVPITLASDFDQLREKWVKSPMKYLTAAHLDPRGERIVLTARGRVFVAPIGDGRWVRASHAEGVRYRDADFMPDGKTLVALSDETGELELSRLPANGVGPPSRLTDNGTILRFAPRPSPDGKWIVFSDNNNDLWLLEAATGSQRRISTNREGVGEPAFSPDSRYLVYAQTARNSFRQLYLYRLEDGTRTPLTSDRVNSVSPRFSPDGRWVYFLSDRNLRSVVGAPWGPRQPEPFFDKPMKIYQIALVQGLRSPFAPNDELHEAEPSKGETEDAAQLPVELDGIARRIREVPVPPGDYRRLFVGDESLFFLSREVGPEPVAHLIAVPIGNEKVEPVRLVEGVEDFELSADGKKLLVRRGDELYVLDAGSTPPQNLEERRVDVSGWSFPIDVREDWRQIFLDAWRLERDYFYDPNMHGVDWTAVRDKYLPLVDRVTTRSELSDLIGRAVGELSALHTSVRGGDHREGPDELEIASLGARLSLDPTAGGYRIEHIYQGDPDYPSELSPLDDPNLGITEGDVITSVNGVDTASVVDIGALLRNQAGRQVLLRLKSESGGDSRDVVVTPMADEAGLRYTDWEYTRRLEVEDRGEGKIGYVHLRAMGARDLTAWYRQFYPVFDRQGLIIDVRRNRGGNIDSILLEKLIRKAWAYWKSRVGEPYWNMQYAFRGHMVVLVNENTASDGEAFALGFRRLGLGKVIGTRTWGGEIWLSSVNRLSDLGLARAPMSGLYGPEGEWLIEGHGLEPDIVVDNLPHATFEGEDAQLDTAIDFLLDEIERDPRPVPAPPPYPDKSFRYPKTTEDSGPGGARPEP